MPSDRIRSVAVVVTAVAEVVVGSLSSTVGGDVGAISDQNRSPVTPAGYAFAIWGLIYLAALALAVYQARPGQREREVHRRTGWWLVAAFTASTVWVPVFVSGAIWLSQVIILGLVACLAVAARQFVATGPAATTTERLALRLPVTLYLGWATLAAAAGFGTTFRSLGMPERAGWVTGVSLVLVLMATAVSVVAVGRLVAVVGYAFTAGWALVAVAAATDVFLVRIAAVGALLVILAVLARRTSTSREPRTVLFG
ncbi:hypothetical protein [uncultured Friedmanniella sp.]|uniref:hypothetical protein n=1 Tax=uncultured Friedmanniella sp. TaxID=335381 RepID=UPI0035CBA1BD